MTTMVSTSRGMSSLETNQGKRDVASKIYLLDPTAAPFTAIINQISKKAAITSKIEWYYDVLCPPWDAVNYAAGYASGDTSIVVDNGGYFAAYNLVKIPRTGEVMSVTSVSSNTLTVERGYGTTAAAAIVDNDPLLIIGSSLEDGLTSSPAMKSTKAENQYNYLQEFRRTVQITQRLANSDVYGENDRTYQRRKVGVEIAKDVERAFLYGERKQDTSGSLATTHYRYSTGGLLYYITSNTTDIAGAMSETAFETALRTIFAHGSSERWMFCSPLVNSVISTWARGKLNTETEDQQYGIAVKRYASPHGIVKIVEHKLLEGTTYGGYAILLDLKEGDIVYRYLQNCDMTFKPNLRGPGIDESHTYEDEYNGIIGLQVGSQANHGIIYGITGAA